MGKEKIDRNFVSEDDKFLMAFDDSHQKSPSQLKEIQKHQRIAELRDNPEAGEETSEIWEGF